MSSALLKLREQSRLFSTTEQEIAGYILENPRLVVDLSIHELAKRTFSSASSIVRLCNHTGYSGYKEFRKAVTYEIATRESSYRCESGELSLTDTLQDIIDKVTYANVVTLQETRELLDMTVLRACLELVKTARVVYLFALGYSLSAARELQLRLLQLNRMCVLHEDWHAQQLQAKNARDTDLGIVISHSGTTAEVLECMKMLKENNTPTIALTRCISSPLCELADQKLYTTANESLFRDGPIAALPSQLNVVDILCTALASEQQAQSGRLPMEA